MFGLTFREATIIIASLVVVLGCWAFFELADKVTEGDILSFDNQVLTALRNPDDLSDPIGPKWLETAMRDFSSLGSTAVLVVLILSVVGFLILNKRHRQALLIALTSVAGVLLVVGLKYLFIRERPDSVPHLTEVASGSYPSGHAMMSAVVYLSLAFMVAPMLKRKRSKIYVTLVALTATILVGISRVYLGVHYPTDVLAGWAVGLAWAALSWLIFQYLNHKSALNRKTYDTS